MTFWVDATCTVFTMLTGKNLLDVEMFPGFHARFRADPMSDDPTVAERPVFIGFVQAGIFQPVDPGDQFQYSRVEDAPGEPAS